MPNYFINQFVENSSIAIFNNIMKCPKCNLEHNNKGKYCSRKCANSRQWSEADKLKKSISSNNSLKVQLAKEAQKGKKKGPMSDDIKEKIRKTTKKQYQEGRKVKPRTITEELKRKLREHALRRNFGGYNPNSIKKHKKGKYKNYWCDSSWELAFVIYNIDHEIKFERNNKKFKYYLYNSKRNFIPDFLLEDGTYVEIKGYVGVEAKAKIEQFKEKLEVIDSQKIKKYLEYVQEKYGKDFTNLYETNIYVGDA